MHLLAYCFQIKVIHPASVESLTKANKIQAQYENPALPG
jgi:hypothetical protein